MSMRNEDSELILGQENVPDSISDQLSPVASQDEWPPKGVRTAQRRL